MIKLEDFLTFAETSYHQLKSENDSIEIRNCVSRAYYYVFHFIRNRYYNHPKANFKMLANEEQQREVVDFFDNLKHPDIAKRIVWFKRARNKADYDLHEDIKKKDAEKWIHEAKLIAIRLNKISPI